MSKDYIKTIPQFFLPKRLLTGFAGLFANIQTPVIKNGLIRHFIKVYRVDMNEAKETNPESYACFNDFFIRQLNPTYRTIESADIVSPVDGYLSEFGSIRQGLIMQAKGRSYSLEDLLASREALSEQFVGGHFATFYLSPQDYHRIHMPVQANLKEMVYIPGKLFSVQPSTTRTIPNLFARNERLVAFFTTKFGLMAMVLVGATIVGAIGTRWQGDIKRTREKQYFDFNNEPSSHTAIQQGEEMGYFKLGSTVIVLLARSEPIAWRDNLHVGSKVRYGQAVATINDSQTTA